MNHRSPPQRLGVRQSSGAWTAQRFPKAPEHGALSKTLRGFGRFMEKGEIVDCAMERLKV
jgi:hypothetical protein